MDGLVDKEMHIKLHKLQEITNNFAKDRLVGEGGFGKVYKGLYNGRQIAVKKLHQLHDINDKAFNNEFQNLCKIQHPNIVQLIGYCYDVQRKFAKTDEGRTILADVMERVLCFEFVEGGDLEKHITAEPCGFNWPTCFKIIKDTCEGLHCLHTAAEKPILHLDLKPANILLDKVTKTAKIGDLGLSRLVSKTLATQKPKGTYGYMPLEFLRNGTMSRKFDVYSLGVLIIDIMNGKNGDSYCSKADPDSRQFIELVTRKWMERLDTAEHSSALEEDILQVQTCIKLALRCVDDEKDNRPEMKDIMQKLQKLEPRVDEISFDYSDMSQGLVGLQEDLNATVAASILDKSHVLQNAVQNFIDNVHIAQQSGNLTNMDTDAMVGDLDSLTNMVDTMTQKLITNK